MADAEEVDELIESGQSEQMFQNAILEAGRGHIEDTLLEIAERREAVKEDILEPNPWVDTSGQNP